jgi:hypothetical protein
MTRLTTIAALTTLAVATLVLGTSAGTARAADDHFQSCSGGYRAGAWSVSGITVQTVGDASGTVRGYETCSQGTLRRARGCGATPRAQAAVREPRAWDLRRRLPVLAPELGAARHGRALRGRHELEHRQVRHPMTERRGIAAGARAGGQG